jgi:tetratricopeptide (TPR) repeat protein
MMKRLILLTLLQLGFMTSTHAQSVSDLMAQGDVYDKQTKPAEALKFYLPAEKIAPENVALLIRMSRQYSFLMTEATAKDEKMKQGKIALTYAERAVALAPKDSDAQLSLAICLGKLTSLQSNKEKIASSRLIKSSVEKAVALNPKNDYAWHVLGRWHMELANLNVFMRAIAELIYGSLPKATNAEAVKCFEKAIAINPNRLLHQIELGRTYARAGNKEQAKKYLEKGLAMPEKEPDDADAKARARVTLKSLEG